MRRAVRFGSNPRGFAFSMSHAPPKEGFGRKFLKQFYTAILMDHDELRALLDENVIFKEVEGEIIQDLTGSSSVVDWFTKAKRIKKVDFNTILDIKSDRSSVVIQSRGTFQFEKVRELRPFTESYWLTQDDKQFVVTMMIRSIAPRTVSEAAVLAPPRGSRPAPRPSKPPRAVKDKKPPRSAPKPDDAGAARRSAGARGHGQKRNKIGLRYGLFCRIQEARDPAAAKREITELITSVEPAFKAEFPQGKSFCMFYFRSAEDLRKVMGRLGVEPDRKQKLTTDSCVIMLRAARDKQ
eukprot:gnl/Chilomastix_cuspidata/1046.p2 GENE.gnl/Chilomastix_cuspidata/1046~~gnl/Chilomastix_cuspidata/1046.p2  ORF type:complete len:295 (-),score=90.15 gnl/Chilomastix_cuspidata/1046:83-967(-)